MCGGIRFYSKSLKLSLYNYINDSLKYFENSHISSSKSELLDFIKNKSGIYMWYNKINHKIYIGSSVDLKRRFLEYFNINRISKETSMPINKALVKYGYENFSIFILEFCSIEELYDKELFYFDKYSPTYNLLKIPGSPSRSYKWTHTEETKFIMSKLMKKKMRKFWYKKFIYSISIFYKNNLY